MSEQTQHKNQPVLPILVCAIGLLNAISLVERADPNELFLRSIGLGAALAEVTWLAVWAVFGRWNWSIRIPITLGAICFLSRVSAAQSSPSWQEWLSFYVAQASIATIPLLLMRESGFRFADQGSHAPTTSTPVLKRYQLSLKSLVVMLSSAAIAFGTVRVMKLPGGDGSIIAPISYLILFTSLGVATMWLTLCQNSRLLRLLFVTVITPVLGAVTAGVPNGDPTLFLAAIATFVATFGVVIGLVVRLSGFPLVRKDV